MLGWLKHRNETQEQANALYLALVAKIREPVFYEKLGVPDTLDGRFDLMFAHAALVFERLASIKTRESQKLSQALFDTIFRNMETSLREMGIGDMGVPRHIKRMMVAGKGRTFSYGEALQNKNREELASALRRNLYGTAVEVAPETLSVVTSYMIACANHMQDIHQEHLLAAVVGLPSAEKYADTKETITWVSAA